MRQDEKAKAKRLIAKAQNTELKILLAVAALPSDKHEQLWLYL